MQIRFHHNFRKQFQKLNRRQREKAEERLATFIENPFDPVLRNHPLKGRYLDYRSIDLSGDLRAIYKYKSENEAIFVILGKHSELYK